MEIGQTIEIGMRTAGAGLPIADRMGMLRRRRIIRPAGA
jgi:hypothetical protein